MINTIGQVLRLYPKYLGPDRPAATTLVLNVHALRALLRETGTTSETAQDALPLSHLTGDLIWKWQESKRELAAAADDDERAQQILRSANSRLRQARSIFAQNEDLASFYHHNDILLPGTLATFRSAAPFSGMDKQEYHAPGDAIIVATFAALEKLGQAAVAAAAASLPSPDRNLYVAIWLAIGFGLRKAEIAVARRSWFHEVDGSIHCRGDVLAKNGRNPEIRGQLGAWAKLAPLLDPLSPDAFVLDGTLTERQDLTFRRISEWMRLLGWETQHHIHEFRAWAGCQIAMAPGGRGLLDAMVFMRHASFQTTEKYYGHHLKLKLNEVKLSLPVVKEFAPTILSKTA